MNEPIIIAEAGVNHNGKINLAKKLIDLASNAKADYVKFQTFKAHSLVTKKVRVTKYQKVNQPHGSTQYQMLKKYELSYEGHLELINYCKSIRLILSQN
jgi:sialic acid synthase SpsE